MIFYKSYRKFHSLYLLVKKIIIKYNLTNLSMRSYMASDCILEALHNKLFKLNV